MADILIRGMEMPDGCHNCGFSYFDKGETNDGEPCTVLMCSAMNQGTNGAEYDGNRPSWCPLVPLPEGHGNLIEQKALNFFPDYKEVRNGIKRTIKEAERDGRVITGVSIDLLKQTLVALDSLRSVRRYFLNAKTIVPAEGGTDDGN